MAERFIPGRNGGETIVSDSYTVAKSVANRHGRKVRTRSDPRQPLPPFDRLA
jgi:hypothetical protein